MPMVEDRASVELKLESLSTSQLRSKTSLDGEQLGEVERGGRDKSSFSGKTKQHDPRLEFFFL